MRVPVAIAILLTSTAVLTPPGGSDTEAATEVEVEFLIPVDEAPSSFQIIVGVRVTSEGRPIPGALVNLSSTPNSTYIPDSGLSGDDGVFRAVFFTPPATRDELVELRAVVTHKGNESAETGHLLVYPGSGGEPLSLNLTTIPQVLGRGEEGRITVNITDTSDAPVSNVTILLIADPPLLEFGTAAGLTDRNGSFSAVARAISSPVNRQLDLRIQAVRRGMTGVEAHRMFVVLAHVPAPSIWEAYGPALLLVAALSLGALLVAAIYVVFVKELGRKWSPFWRNRETAPPPAPVMMHPQPGSVPPATDPPPPPGSRRTFMAGWRSGRR